MRGGRGCIWCFEDDVDDDDDNDDEDIENIPDSLIGPRFEARCHAIAIRYICILCSSLF